MRNILQIILLIFRISRSGGRSQMRPLLTLILLGKIVATSESRFQMKQTVSNELYIFLGSLNCVNYFIDLDDLSCHVSNSIGESEPCAVDINLSLMVSKRNFEELLTIIIIVGAVLATLVIISVITCCYCRKKKSNKGEHSISALRESVSPCHFQTN